MLFLPLPPHFNHIYIVLIYFVLNIFYSLKLKHVAILDVIIIAIGFVLRVIEGAVIAAVPLSKWIVLMTFLLSLLLAFAKRRDDVIIFEKTGIKVRPNLSSYNLEFLNSVLSLLSAITIICYIMYTVSDEVMQRLESSYLYLTSLFVIAGILRYLQLTQVSQKSGSPTKILFRDRFIQMTVLGWVFSYFWIIYV